MIPRHLGKAHSHHAAIGKASVEQTCTDQARENSLGDQIVKGFWGDGLSGHGAFRGRERLSDQPGRVGWIGFFAEAVFDALEDIFQVRLDDLVEDFSPLASAREEPAALHESEVLGGHGGWDLASFRQLGDRNLLRLEHLEHAKAVGVSEHLEALGGLSERLEARQLGRS